MSLTRQYLKSIGVEAEKIDSIIEAHSETVEGLKSKIAEATVDKEAFQEQTKEFEKTKSDLEKANKSIESYKTQLKSFDELKAERDSLKTNEEALNARITELTAKETETDTELSGLKEKLTAFETEKAQYTADAENAKKELENYKAQVETDKANTAKREAVRLALRNGGVVRTDFQDLIVNSMNLDDVTMEDNAIKDVDQFIESTKTKYPSCFGKVEEVGTPPINPVGGNPPQALTLEQIKGMSPEEINKNWDAVQAALKKGV